MLKTGILIIAFNRPNLFLKSFKAILKNTSGDIYISIDGPRKDNLDDVKKINKILSIIASYKGKRKLKIKSNKTNLGIRYAIPNAINWVLEENDSIIVVEDDLIVSKIAFELCTYALRKYKNDKRIGAISGYCNEDIIKYVNTDTTFRKSVIAESYMWATWKKKWRIYSDDFKWEDVKKKLIEYSKIKNNWFYFIWKIRAFQAKNNIVQTWAYRWIFSLWNNKMFVLSPNFKVSEYVGHISGTNTKFQTKKTGHLEIRKSIKTRKDLLNYNPELDLIYAKKSLGMSLTGTLILIAQTIILHFRKIVKPKVKYCKNISRTLFTKKIS